MFSDKVFKLLFCWPQRPLTSTKKTSRTHLRESTYSMHSVKYIQPSLFELLCSQALQTLTKNCWPHITILRTSQKGYILYTVLVFNKLESNTKYEVHILYYEHIHIHMYIHPHTNSFWPTARNQKPIEHLLRYSDNWWEITGFPKLLYILLSDLNIWWHKVQLMVLSMSQFVCFYPFTDLWPQSIQHLTQPFQKIPQAA